MESKTCLKVILILTIANQANNYRSENIEPALGEVDKEEVI
jgi:hypothetical protein